MAMAMRVFKGVGIFYSKQRGRSLVTHRGTKFYGLRQQKFPGEK
jgi:hypothetical protein